MNKNIVVPKLRSFFQNRTSLIVIGLLMTILVSACGNSAAPQSGKPIFSQINVAMTAFPNAQGTTSAQEVNPITPTAPPSPTSMPTMTPTVTPTATPTITPQTGYYSTYYSCSNSEFIKDMTIPDGTILTPGETFTKTWKFKNTGSCNWTSGYSIVFVSGRRMNGSSTEIDQTVDVNKRADISVELIAPNHEGTYIGYWRLADEYGNTFGETVYVKIVVEAATATSTPAAPGEATLFYPTGTITTNTPTYTWNEVSGASQYLLQVNGLPGNVIQTWYTAAQANCNGTTCSVTPTTTLSSGVYIWWIQTWNSAGYGPGSNDVNFMVSASQTPTSTVPPIATNTPEPTSTPIVLPDTPTATPTSIPALTATPVATNTPEPTSTPIVLPDTPTVAPTFAPVSTITPRPTKVPTDMPTATPTDDDSKDHS